MKAKDYPGIPHKNSFFTALVLSFVAFASLMLVTDTPFITKQDIHLSIKLIILGASIFLSVWISTPLLLFSRQIGRAIAGYLAGFRFIEIRAGQFYICKQNDQIKFGFNAGRNMDKTKESYFYKGIPKNDLNLERKLLIFSLGGPLISLITCVIIWILITNTSLNSNNLPPILILIKMILLLTMFESMLIFFYDMIPAKTSENSGNDGSYLLSILQGNPRRVRDYSVYMLENLSINGCEAAQWPKSLIDKAILVTDGSLVDSFGIYYAFWHYASTNNEITAKSFLKTLLERENTLPIEFAVIIKLDAAHFEASYWHNLEAAKSYLEQIEPFPNSEGNWLQVTPTYHGVKAEILLAEGSQDAASEVRLALETFEPTQRNILTKRWLNALAARVGAQL